MTDSTPDLVAVLDATDPAIANGNPDPAPADPATAPETPPSDGDDTIPGEDALGDPGKQALERMKDKLKEERRLRREAEARLNDGAAPDDPERIQREADTRALAKANDRIVRAEVRAAAAGKLSDPTDALNFIDLTQFEVDDDGSIDQTEIADAIADLLSKKPYLAAQGETRTPQPDPSQGAAGSGTATTADRFASAVDGLL